MDIDFTMRKSSSLAKPPFLFLRCSNWNNPVRLPSLKIDDTLSADVRLHLVKWTRNNAKTQSIFPFFLELKWDFSVVGNKVRTESAKLASFKSSLLEDLWFLYFAEFLNNLYISLFTLAFRYVQLESTSMPVHWIFTGMPAFARTVNSPQKYTT